MKMFQFLILSLTLFLNSAIAAPFKLDKAYSFKGKVNSYLWVGPSHFKYEGDSFTLSESKDAAAYYVLIDTEKAAKKDYDDVSSMIGHLFSGLSHPFHFTERKEKQVMLYIPVEKIKGIKKGSLIEVESYTGWGDEHMSIVKWKKLSVNGVLINSPKK